MDNIDKLIFLAEACVGPVIDELYRRLLERDYAQDDPEVAMLTGALTNILGHDNSGDRFKEAILIAAWGEQVVLDRPSLRVLRWRNGALSGSDLAHELGVGSTRTYQPVEMPLSVRPRPGLRSRHQAFYQQMSSKAASFTSLLKAAMPAQRPRVEEEVQANETMEDLNETKDELERGEKPGSELKKIEICEGTSFATRTKERR